MSHLQYQMWILSVPTSFLALWRHNLGVLLFNSKLKLTIVNTYLTFKDLIQKTAFHFRHWKQWISPSSNSSTLLGAAIKLSKCRLRGAKAFLFNWNNKFYMELPSFIEERLFKIENLFSIFNDRLAQVIQGSHWIYIWHQDTRKKKPCHQTSVYNNSLS